MSRTVLLTGTYGLVGRDTVKRLAADGWRVVATVHRTGGRLPDGVEARTVDLGDADAVFGLVTEVAPDAIVHLAAVLPPLCYRDRAAAQRCNVDGTVALVKAAEAQRNPPKFLHASSVAIFGARNPYRVNDRITLDTPPKPCELYGAHKLEAERVVRSSQLPWTLLRLGGVASVDPDAMPFSSDRLYFGSLIPAESRLHTVDTRDVAAAFAAALTNAVYREILYIGGDDTHLLREDVFTRQLAQTRGMSGLPGARPGNPESDTDWYPVGDWMDVARAQELLKFQHHPWPQMLDEMRHTAGWRRYPTKLASPLISAALRRHSAYHHAPGTYADPWAAIRARFGEPGP